MEQIKVHVSDLQPNPLNDYEMLDLDELKNSIATYGLLSPLTAIGPTDGGKYILIAGERRFHAATELLKEGRFDGEMPVLVVGGADMTERHQRLLIEVSNVETREFNRTPHLFKIFGILKEMADSGEIREKSIAAEAAKYLSVSEHYCRDFQAIFNSGAPRIKEKVKKGEMSVRDGAALSRMPEALQDEAVKAIDAGEKNSSVVRRMKVKNGTPKRFAGVRDVEFDDQACAETPFGMSVNYGVDPDSLDVDATRHEIGALKNEQNRQDEEAYKAKLRGIRKWCDKIKLVENPTMDELKTIKACIEVAECFS